MRLRSLRRLLRDLSGVSGELAAVRSRLDELAILQAEPLVQRIRAGGATLRDAEFKVFSQFGEDGIIQYLVHALDVPPELQVFVEIGVENYTEANTRYLLIHNNWRGLVVDGGAEHIAHVRADPISWRHDLAAVHAFVTRDTIDSILVDNGFDGELGLLSLDVDGVDYWLLEALQAASPLILVLEYNSVFGPDHAVTVPYRDDFRRAEAHWSYLYWGASLKALWIAAQKKGYELVCCNAAGNNAFFVRRDRLGTLAALSPQEAWVESRFRDSRDADGNLSHVGGAERRRLIEGLPLVEVESGRTVRLADLGG